MDSEDRGLARPWEQIGTNNLNTNKRFHPSLACSYLYIYFPSPPHSLIFSIQTGFISFEGQ